MAQQIGCSSDEAPSQRNAPGQGIATAHAKKKGCKKKKCSHWKGGRCRCGRE
jgi:hypothetical protein